MGRIVEDEFMAELMKKGYTVASRSDVEAVLKELDFQNKSGLTDADAARVGKMLNTQGVIIVEFPGSAEKLVFGNRDYIRLNVRCSARVVSVELNRVLWLGTKDVAEDVALDSFSTARFAQPVREVAALLPPRK